jgi:glutamate carboxypeptidase
VNPDLVRRMHIWLEERRPEMTADLADFVTIETPSTDKQRLDAAATWLGEWVTRHLGTADAVIRTPGGTYGDTLRLGYPGTGQPVTFLCHYDTVWPAGTIDKWPFRIEGSRATGPGVFDMKAGLVQAVWALRAARECGAPTPPVRLVLNGDEEIGSPAARPLIEQACQDAAAVLVFESAVDGALKTARKGIGIYTVTTTGIEAHAGLDPTAGASAVAEMARLICTLHELTDLEAGTTVNVGTVHGGTRSNVTAGRAVAEVDARAASQAEAEKVNMAILGLSTADHRVSVRVEGGWNRPVMERTQAVAEIFGLARTVASAIGLDLREASVGGGSDGNFAAALGRPVLDGIGAVGAGAHARHEYVELDEMPRRAALAAGLLTALANPS